MVKMRQRWAQWRWIAAAAAVVVVALFYVFGPALIRSWTAVSVSSDQLAIWESATRSSIATLAGALVVATGLIFTSRSANASARQQMVAEQGQLADRFTKAVGQLTDDSLAVRVGAVHALTRLVDDSARDARAVADVLTQHVRHCRPRCEPDTSATDEFPVDLQMAINCIAHAYSNVAEPAPIDLRHTDLRGVVLSGPGWGTVYRVTNEEHVMRDISELGPWSRVVATAAWRAIRRQPGPAVLLARADLRGARLSRADLGHADMTEALLDRADLSHARLAFAVLDGARLEASILEGVDATSARFACANMAGARMGTPGREDEVGPMLLVAFLHYLTRKVLLLGSRRVEYDPSPLFRFTRLREAYMQGANLRGACLNMADLRDADLSSADLRGADLRWTRLRDPGERWGRPRHVVQLAGALMDCGTELELEKLDYDSIAREDGACEVRRKTTEGQISAA